VKNILCQCLLPFKICTGVMERSVQLLQTHYVTQDRSVMEFGTQEESQKIHTVCPAKSRILKESPGSISSTIGNSRILNKSPGSTSTPLVVIEL
jgi:hypothetical protein